MPRRPSFQFINKRYFCTFIVKVEIQIRNKILTDINILNMKNIYIRIGTKPLFYFLSKSNSCRLYRKILMSKMKEGIA